MLNFNNIRSNNRRRSYAAWPRAELYEELGDGLNIQIHSKNQRFIKRIKEAYCRLKENPIGIRLVDDIRRLRTSTKDPCWIVECRPEDAPPPPGDDDVWGIPDSSFLYKIDIQVANFIYINIDQNFHYYGFYKEDLKDKLPSEVISLRKFISGQDELDITLFHEMNHYRHYLQIGGDKYNAQQEPFNASESVKYKTMMFSDEELLQLTGCLYGIQDNIYEMSYRVNRLHTPIRYPYAANDEYEPNEYVKSIATAGYFADLLTPN